MKILYTLPLALLGLSALAQPITDEVITGPNYANDVWYSLENGIVAEAPKDEWDLAFEISGFTSAIRFNEQKGMALYAAPYTVGQWNDLTEADTDNWQQLHDDPARWERGAFNLHTTSDFDLGWGIYNMVTHVVAGDSLYVIQLADGTLRKLRIDALASGTYTFTHALLDGSDEVQAQLVKANFTGRNFGYYSFATNSTLNREPESTAWDLLFTRYMDVTGPENTPYGVTGVLHNYGRQSAQANDTPVEEAVFTDFTFSTDINTIGYDWKTFDFTQGFILEENLSYFVQTATGTVYHLVFTDFEGSATGLYQFGVEEVGQVASASGAADSQFALYPNPLSTNTLTIQAQATGFRSLSVLSTSGKVMHRQALPQGVNRYEVNLPDLAPGLYLVRLEAGRSVSTQKLIVK